MSEARPLAVEGKSTMSKDELRTELVDSKIKIEKLNIELIAARDYNLDLQKKCNSLSEKEREVTEAKETIGELRQELAQHEEEAKSVVTKWNDAYQKLKEERSSLMQGAQITEREVSEQHKMMEALKRKVKKMEADAAVSLLTTNDARQNRADLMQERDDLKKQLSDMKEEIEELHRTLNTAKSDNEQVRVRVDEFDTVITDQRTQIANLNTELQRERGKLVESQQNERVTAEALQQVRAGAAMLETQFATASVEASKVPALLTEVEDHKADAEELRDRLRNAQRAAEQEVNVLVGRHKEAERWRIMEGQMDQCLQKEEEERHRVESYEHDEFMRVVMDAHRQWRREALRAEALGNTKAFVRDLTRSFELSVFDCTSELQRAVKRIEQTQVEEQDFHVRDLQRRLDTAQTAKSEIAEAMRGQSQELAELQTKLRAVSQGRNESEEQIQQLEQRLSRIRQASVSTQRHAESAKDELHRARRFLHSEQSTKSLPDLIDAFLTEKIHHERDRSEEKLESERVRRSELKRVCIEWSERYAEAEDTMKRIRQERSDAQNERDEFHKQLQKLQEQSEPMRNDMSRLISLCHSQVDQTAQIALELDALRAACRTESSAKREREPLRRLPLNTVEGPRRVPKRINTRK